MIGKKVFMTLVVLLLVFSGVIIYEELKFQFERKNCEISQRTVNIVCLPKSPSIFTKTLYAFGKQDVEVKDDK